jgi:regulation of enolase protein 1 (concanavalin A-like superfamily)
MLRAMRGGLTLRLQPKLIIILMLSVVVTLLDVSLIVRPRLLSETDEGEDRGETFGRDALQFQLMKLRDGRGHIPPNAYGIAKAHVDRLRNASMLRGVESAAAPQVSSEMFSASSPASALGPAPIAPRKWRWLGPGNVGGRIRAIVVSPTTPTTMFAGSVGGGIWKTTTSGASWSPVNDFMASLSVATLAVDPANPSVMYAGTGEGFGNADAIRGAGIFKSVDGGTTWTQIAGTETQSTAVNRIAIAPTGTTVLAATDKGLWRSVNGGAFTFVNTTITPQDVDFNPIDAQKIVTGGYGSILYSWDGGGSWHRASGVPATAGRVELAYAKSQPDTVYALVDYEGGTLYRSSNGGATFSAVSSTPLLDNGQGWYDAALWVNPKDSNHVIVGGVYLRATVDGGATWTTINNGIHVDHHAIVEDPRFDDVSNRTVFIGNDGGVYRAGNIRTVAQSGYSKLDNTLGVTQFYGGAGNAASGTIIGGTQDNGTVVRRPDYGASWSQTLGGDGGAVAADPTDPSYFYSEMIYLQLFRSSTGGGTWTAIGSGIGDAGTASNFIAPFVLDPNDSSRMYAGGAHLWVSANVKSAAPAWKAIFGSATSNYISAIGVAPSVPDIVWVGLNYGNVYRSTNATAATPTFTAVQPPTLGNFVTRITVSPFDPNVVYVMTGGFGSQNLLKTSDGGATWIDATGGDTTGLPNVPISDLEVDPQDPDTLYAATEVGVFTSHDGGAAWDVPQSGPANVAVDELFWMGTTLVAATHGRGMYSIDVNGAGTPSVTASATTLDFGSQPLNTPTAMRRVTITNTGTAPLTIYSIAIAGANAHDYPQLSYTCAGTLPAGGTCTADTLFSPLATGTRVARISLQSNASNGALSIALRGVGVSTTPPPSPWSAQDVGSVAIAGTAAYANGTFTVKGSGADIWGTADAFQFVHQPLTGDGTIVARVATVENVQPWTKAGVMIRDGVGAGAANAALVVSPGRGLSFQYRKTAGGLTTNVPTTGAAPKWVQLTRAGSVISAAVSSDGTAWAAIGSVTIGMASTIQIGLIVTSHSATQAATATFDRVAVTAASSAAGALPAGWLTSDVGAVGKAGSASDAGGTFSVTGAGADIWGTADAFRFVNRQLAADGTVVARVATVQNVNAWTKAGIMVRQSLAAGSAHASIFVTPSKGIAFQRRTSSGTTTLDTTIAGAAPAYLKLSRAGSVVTASTSADGTTWKTVGQQTLSISGAVWIGFAVTSHDATRTATATFDRVSGTGW